MLDWFRSVLLWERTGDLASSTPWSGLGRVGRLSWQCLTGGDWDLTQLQRFPAINHSPASPLMGTKLCTWNSGRHWGTNLGTPIVTICPVQSTYLQARIGFQSHESPTPPVQPKDGELNLSQGSQGIFPSAFWQLSSEPSLDDKYLKSLICSHHSLVTFPCDLKCCKLGQYFH